MTKAPWRFSLALLLGLPLAGFAAGCGGGPVPEDDAPLASEGPKDTTTALAANSTVPTAPGGSGELANPDQKTPSDNGLSRTSPDKTSSATPNPTPGVASPPAPEATSKATTSGTAAASSPSAPAAPTKLAPIPVPAKETTTTSLKPAAPAPAKPNAGIQVAALDTAHVQAIGGVENAGGGTIHGKVVWSGDLPQLPATEPKKDPQVCGAHGNIPDQSIVVDPESKGVEYVIAYLSKPSGAAAAAKPARPVMLDQKGCLFVPHIVGVQAGQKLEFASQDPINHNIHTNPFKNVPKNFLLSGGAKQDLEFRAESLPIKVTCDIHPWMSAYVLVSDSPYFAITGKDGSFEIKGVPAGSQKLVLWQERVGYLPGFPKLGKAVTVEAGQTVDIGPVTLQALNLKR